MIASASPAAKLYVDKYHELYAQAEDLEEQGHLEDALDTYEKAIGNMLAAIKSMSNEIVLVQSLMLANANNTQFLPVLANSGRGSPR